MSATPYKAPQLNASAFNCPICTAYSAQIWGDMGPVISGVWRPTKDGRISICSHCGATAIWYQGALIHPGSSPAPLPNSDLPAEVAADYREARDILPKSPRGATALLRLAIQKLCGSLGESGKDLNGDIASLVKKGLPVRLQQALDTVRVIGNNAVHPGQIDIRDDTDTATILFELVNMISDSMIGQPKRVEAVYSKLPQSQLDAIKKRDGG